MNVGTLEKRRQIGDKYIRGRGIEIGAGITPSRYRFIDDIIIVDKRSKAELKALFKAEVPYEVHSLESAQGAFPMGADFILAHQVLEHSHDPIGTLKRWLGLLRPDGVLFIDVPAASAPFEDRRPRTPIEHMLDDFAFQRDETDYDSAQHVYSFIHNWAVMRPQDCWYAQKDVKTYIDVCLAEGLRKGHDFHWHTFTMDTFRQVIEVASFFAGSAVEFLHLEEHGGALLVVGRRRRDLVEPECLRVYQKRLAGALAQLKGIEGDMDTKGFAEAFIGEGIPPVAPEDVT